MENENETSLTIRTQLRGASEKTLQKYEERLKSISDVIKTFPKNFNVATDYSKQLSSIEQKLGNFDKNITSINNNLKPTKTSIEQIGKVTKIAFNYTTLREFTRILQRATKTMTTFVKRASDYGEDINLFQVAFDYTYRSAERFVNTMTEMYGLDEDWLTRTVGIFKQLSNAMNLSTEEGTKLSKLMTQMSLDISSLYNLDVDRGASVLQSALAGQTKPIRGATGADITQATLQQTLNQLGLDKSITDLSYAEKRLVIIVSLTQQLRASVGDMAKTIEQPANQTRILNEQWQRLTRSVGNVFLPLVKTVLPYLNAILMVLTEIINVIAGLAGYNISDFNAVAGVADSVLELEDGLNSASDSAEKLKRGLRSFDKLNNITTPNDNGKSNTKGLGGIDPAIWNAFNDAYDDYFGKLTNVQMKATKIRDTIMEILGFEKQIDPLTGDISFKYLGWQTTVKNLWNWFKKLSPEAKLLTGLIATLITKGTIKLVTSFVKLIGSTGMYKWFTKLISPVKELSSYLIPDLIGGFKSLGGRLEESVNAWSKTLTIVDRLKISLVGAGGIYASFKLIESAMKDLNEQNELTTTGLLKLGGGIAGATASGALLGSQFGAWGAVIGGLVGGIGALYKAFMEAPTSTSVLINELDTLDKKERDFFNSIHETNNAIQEQLNANLIQTGVHNNLVKELEKITDENGKVKQGYEERAKFILNELSQAYGVEYVMTDNIIENYDDYIQKIKDLIKTKEAEYLLDANRQAYMEAIKNETQMFAYMEEAEKKLTKAKKEQKEIQEAYNVELEKYKRMISGEDGVYATYDIEQQRLAMEKLKKQYEDINGKVKEYQETYDNATIDYKNNILTQQQYSELQTGFMTGNLEKIEREVEKYTNSYIENGNLRVATEEENNRRLAENWGILLENYKNNGDERYQFTLDELAKETKAVEDITPEQVEKWRVLGLKDKDGFIQEFSKLDKDIQQKVVDKMYDKGYKVGEEIQKGINDFPPPTVEVQAKLKNDTQTLKVTADTSQASAKTQTWWDKFKMNAQQVLGTMFPIPTLRFADGGLPPVGQLFVANEKGAELVGNIGGQSFVANQNQVVDLLDRKLSDVNAGIQNATFIFQVGEEKIEQVMLNNLQNMAKSNGKPIKIGI